MVTSGSIPLHCPPQRRNVTTWTIDLSARSGALWQISADGGRGLLGGFLLGLAAMLGSPSRSWLGNLYGAV